MSKTFYSHLVEINFLHEELDLLDLSENEKDELKQHVHGSIHYVALDIVLSELSQEHKKVFIKHLNENDHESLWFHLLSNTQGIEEKIKKGVEKTAHEFKEEIHKIKKK